MPWNELLSFLNGHANVFTYEFLPVEVWSHNYGNYKAYESHHSNHLAPSRHSQNCYLSDSHTLKT